MNRYCFQLRVDPARREEYVRRHQAVWPDMLRALAASGWRNYSIFLRDDGLLIGYFESEASFAEAVEAMGRTEVDARWQAEMAPFFVPEAGPEGGLIELTEVFHLEDQLASLGAP